MTAGPPDAGDARTAWLIADLLIAAGSSLQVYPAAGLPEAATAHGARLVIVNIEPTPLDDLATLVVHEKAGEVLGPAVDAVVAG